jgi:hypothetical protein
VNQSWNDAPEGREIVYRRAKQLVRQGREFDALILLQKRSGLTFDQAREVVDALLRGDEAGAVWTGECESTVLSGSGGESVRASAARLVRQGQEFDALILLQKQGGFSFDEARELVDGFLVSDSPTMDWSREHEPSLLLEEARSIPSNVRQAVLDRDDYICRYCGRRSQTIEVDHVIPVSQGGTSTLDNLVTACRTCNRKKGGRRPREAGMEVLPVPTRRRDHW